MPAITGMLQSFDLTAGTAQAAGSIRIRSGSYVSPWFNLTDNVAFYYFVLAAFALAVIALWRLVHSPYGRVIAAIKQSETRAAHLGYNVRLYEIDAATDTRLKTHEVTAAART